MEERGGPWYGAWWVWPWLVLVGLVLLLVAWAFAVFGHLADGLAAAVTGVGAISVANRGLVVRRRRAAARAGRLRRAWAAGDPGRCGRGNLAGPGPQPS